METEEARRSCRYGRMRYSKPIEKADAIIVFESGRGFTRWCADMRKAGVFDNAVSSVGPCRAAVPRAISDDIWKLSRCMAKEKAWYLSDLTWSWVLIAYCAVVLAVFEVNLLQYGPHVLFESTGFLLSVIISVLLFAALGLVLALVIKPIQVDLVASKAKAGFPHR